jgi:hypothetical protein
VSDERLDSGELGDGGVWVRVRVSFGGRKGYEVSS